MKLWHSLAAMVIVAGSSVVAWGDTYKVDPVHSSVAFRIKHMNTAYFHGRVNAPEGTVSYDASKPEASTFEVSMKVENIDTGNADRDKHLRSASFFNATDFPTLTFKSTSVKKTDDTHLDVTGDLTIHGVTKSVTAKVEITGTGEMKGKQLIGFETVFDIKRSDFGMKEMLNMLGDDVRLTVSLEAGKQ
jgi:polyisoprenoid-binding protein YceI